MAAISHLLLSSSKLYFDAIDLLFLSFDLYLTCIVKVQHHRCPPGSTSGHPANNIVEAPINGRAPQRACPVIHALACTNNDGTRPMQMTSQSLHTVQCNPASIHHKIKAIHTIIQLILNLQASQCYMMSCRNQWTPCLNKNIPFSFLVGDMPAYKNIITGRKSMNYLRIYLLSLVHVC